MERLGNAAFEASQEAIRRHEREMQQTHLRIVQRLAGIFKNIPAEEGYQERTFSQPDGLEKFSYIRLSSATDVEATQEGTMKMYPPIFPFPVFAIEPQSGTGGSDLHITRYGALPDIVIGSDHQEYLVEDAYFFSNTGEAIRYDAIYQEEPQADQAAHPHLDFTPLPYQRYISLTGQDYEKIASMLDDIEQAQSKKSEDNHS